MLSGLHFATSQRPDLEDALVADGGLVVGLPGVPLGVRPGMNPTCLFYLVHSIPSVSLNSSVIALPERRNPC
jgi:hypothetical protein